MFTRRPFLLAFLLVLAAPLARSTDGRSPLLNRVVVIGASASQGFGLGNEAGAPVTLADCVRLSLRDPGEVLHGANAMFFQNPKKIGSKELEKALDAQPTLVVAVDFLFWFGYGFAPSDEARLERFELGLALLDRLDCPVLVGTLPDMTPALKGRGPFGGPLIDARQVPPADVREKLNARLEEWVESKKGRAILVPLAHFVEQLNAKEKLELRGNTWNPAEGDVLMQPDLLHPTLDGTIALSLLILDTLETSRDDVSSDDIVWDPATVRTAIMDATAEARRAAEEKKKQREERTRAKEGAGDVR